MPTDRTKHRSEAPTAQAQRAAIYGRVSTEEQAEVGQSIPAQVRLLEEYSARQGMAVVERFLDEGFSATTDKRPAFQRMIALARAKPRPFDVILVHKMDRFARNREHAIVYKNLLRRECGIDVLSITETFDDTPQGRLMEGIMEVMAEFYSANLGQEVRKGMMEKARRGEALGLAPMGYRIGETGRLDPVPGAAEAVRWIFETYASGEMGYYNIAQALRADGHTRFPGLPTLKWSAQAVRQILRNEAYVGRRVWNVRSNAAGGRRRPEEQWVVAEGSHPPLVSTDLFERVQERMKARIGPRGSLGDYLLRGVVRCEECGSVMYRRRMTGRTSSGGQKEILSCSRYYRGDGGCYFNWVSMVDVLAELTVHCRQITEGGTLEQFSFLFPPENEKALAAAQRALEQCAERYRRQVAAYEGGVIDLDELRAAKERLITERVALEARIAAERAKAKQADLPTALIRQRVGRALAALEVGDADGAAARRQVLQEAVAAVTYSRRERRLRITFRV